MNLNNQRILVTGGNGFLGRHLVAELRACGLSFIAPISASCDLTHEIDVERMFDTCRPDLVFHLAAKVGGIGANQAHPGTFFYANMAMGMNVLEAARRYGTKKVVIVGTVCSYPKYTPPPFREDDLWNGYPEETNAPYGIAKKALAVMAEAYRREFGCNFVTVIPANLYGPGDNFDLETSHVIPAMIRKFVEAKESCAREVALWGDGTPTREFLYVDDAVRGLILAAELYDEPTPINLGTGFEVSMRDLAKLIRKEVGCMCVTLWDDDRPNGQPRRQLDLSRAREHLGFEARTSLFVGLKKTIAWYLAQRRTEP